MLRIQRGNRCTQAERLSTMSILVVPIWGLGEHAGEEGVADEGIFVPLVSLVGQRVCKEWRCIIKVQSINSQ